MFLKYPALDCRVKPGNDECVSENRVSALSFQMALRQSCKGLK